MTPHLHRRQFALGPRPRFERSVELAPGLHLSYDEDLPVLVDGSTALIGVALQTLPGRPSPEERLGGEEDWAGRWVLVRDGMVIPDATASLPVFYDGEFASSSAAILAEGRTKRPPLPHGIGMDWYPPPGSAVEGVRRLLPSQVLRDGAPAARLLPTTKPQPPEALLQRMQTRLVTGLQRLAAKGTIALPLTGGHDSRTLLATAVAAGVHVETYTLDLERIASADRDLPPRLAAAVGVPHRYIRATRPPDPRLMELWDEHTACHAVDADRELFAKGQLDEPARFDFDLGDFYEVGRGYYDHVLPARPRDIAATILRELPSPSGDAVREWAAWIAEHPADMDWRDRFYLEQRLGGWLAAIDQGLDLVGVNKIHLASCTGFIAEGLSLPPAMRRAGIPHDELIRRMAPPLSTFPVNPPGPALERIRHRVRRELLEIKTGPDYLVRRARRLRTRLSK
jgi:hypothetical protein